MAIHELTSSLQIGSALVELPIIVNYEYCERKQAIREGGLAISPAEDEHIEIQAVRVMIKPDVTDWNGREYYRVPPKYLDITRLLDIMDLDQVAEIEREILESYR